MVSKIKDLFIIKVNYVDTLTIETYRTNSRNLNEVIRVQRVKQLGLTSDYNSFGFRKSP